MLSVESNHTILNKTLVSHLPPTLGNTSKENLIDYFKNTWELYEILFRSILDDTSFYLSPDPLRNPLIFYYGHTAAFYINKMQLTGIIDMGLNPHFENIFAKGVDPNLPQDLEYHSLWPSIDEVRMYRNDVYKLVLSFLKNTPIPNQITSSDSHWALMMSMEHDRIHFETSSVLIRQLDEALLSKPKGWNYAPSKDKNLKNKWIYVPSGEVSLGKQEPSQLFGWDNEYGTHDTRVAPFFATQNLITNHEYLDFVLSGAYNDSNYWCEQGLKWKHRVKSQHPKFWIPMDGSFLYRAMFDLIDMPLNWPVEVNKYEALAYLAFKGAEYRLLTEDEFKLITSRNYGNEEPALSRTNNLHMNYGSPTPVDFYDTNNLDGFNDLFGNVWDWLDNNFYPLPGFETHPLYTDFSEPYFDEHHSMLLGGSWATSGTGTSKYYRLWFRDHFYQFAGFRIAKNMD